MKWADYVIVGVSFKEERKHINTVKIMQDTGDKLTNVQIVTRTCVVNSIEEGITFVTAFCKDSSWQKGEDVRTIKMPSGTFIRTDSNRTEEDNLGSLPEL